MQLHAAFSLALLKWRAFRLIWKVQFHAASVIALLKWQAFRFVWKVQLHPASSLALVKCCGDLHNDSYLFSGKETLALLTASKYSKFISGTLLSIKFSIQLNFFFRRRSVEIHSLSSVHVRVVKNQQ